MQEGSSARVFVKSGFFWRGGVGGESEQTRSGEGNMVCGL